MSNRSGRERDRGDGSGGSFSLQTLVLCSADLAGFARWAARCEAVEIAALLDRWYAAVAATVEPHGGRIVKLMGDGVFVVFEEDRCRDAIAAARILVALAIEPPLRTGVSLHLAAVAAGELGPPSHRRWDVIGVGVNHLFRMGGGAGLRISEPVYRRLPNDARGPWRKDEPPATYHLREST